MKKVFALFLVLCLTLGVAGCGKTTEPTAEPSTQAPATTEAPDTKSEGVMTYAEYAAAPLDSEVTVETYVQAKQSWWDNKATIYTQDKDGAYFLYNAACDEELYGKLAAGTKIKVSGVKSEWSGEVEIVDATLEIEEGNFIANTFDISALTADELTKHQNEFVAVQGAKVEASKDADGNDVAFLYNWDGSGSRESNSDLYFNVSFNGTTYNFTVESYLCDNTTDVYKAVENLAIGDTVNLEGFLYWYNAPQMHVTAIG